MTYVLLTGAGFSRNWGGWLADEAFEYLIGSPEIDDHLRHLLWKHKRTGGGFEEALAELQRAYNLHKDERTKKPLDDLEAAIVGMFNEMNLAFDRVQFEPTNQSQYEIRGFLARFDAIFTLNQDLLLERHYLNDHITRAQTRKWSGWQTPGSKPFNPNSQAFDPTPAAARAQEPEDPANFKEQPGMQPYYKLHGSANWIGTSGRLLIFAGTVAAAPICGHHRGPRR